MNDTLIFSVIQTSHKFNFGEKYLCFLDNTPAVLINLIWVIYMHLHVMPNMSVFMQDITYKLSNLF